jgi:hypothetical protein
VVSVIGYVAYGRIRDYQDEHRLFVGCHSDKLSVALALTRPRWRSRATRFRAERSSLIR